MRDELIAALEGERDAALEQVDYEREQSRLAQERIEALRGETLGLRGRIRELIMDSERTESRAVRAETTLARRRLPSDTGELTEQLQLALDSSRRLARERDRVSEKLKAALEASARLELENERLQARIRALEGARKVARG